jgi:hypothetical protein
VEAARDAFKRSLEIDPNQQAVRQFLDQINKSANEARQP